MKTLPNIFYTMPEFANMTMDRKDLREVLLDTGGSVLARGVLYDITPKHLGAGVYKVTLSRNKI